MTVSHELRIDSLIGWLLSPIKLSSVSLLQNRNDCCQIIRFTWNNLILFGDQRFSESFWLQIFSFEHVTQAFTSTKLVPRVAVVQFTDLANKAPDVVFRTVEVFLFKFEGFWLC